jgi:hypothetical protein
MALVDGREGGGIPSRRAAEAQRVGDCGHLARILNDILA